MKKEFISITPSMFFISEKDWVIEKKKDTFIKNLIEILKLIDEYQIHRIVWTDKLEEILWTKPQINPWHEVYDTKKSLVPVIYRYLSSNTEIISHSSIELNSISPNFQLNFENEIIQKEYSYTFNYLIENDLRFKIYNNCIKFFYKHFSMISSSNKTINPEILKCSKDYLTSITLDNFIWEFSTSNFETLTQLINICNKVDFENLSILYNYSFSNSFLRKIKNLEEKNRKNLIQKLTKRLCLTRQQAGSDSQLQEEYLKALGVFRFRVTQRPTSHRIHYKYDEINNRLVFLEYYVTGEHDDGLI